MTSEIRANTIKNRVGLGTVSYTNTGIIVSGIVTANSFSGPYNGTDIVGTGITLTSTDAGSAAGPELKLFRNSASPADADYLGQIKFAGESDTGVERNYAKITGKILDASNETEDGILEFAHIKGGSQTITGRWRSDSLQLLNGTSLTVAGTSTFSDHIKFANSGDGIIFGTEGSSDRPSIIGNYVSASDNHIVFNTTGAEKVRIDKDGKVGIGTDIPTYKIHVDSGDAAIGLWKSRRSSGSYIDYSVGANGAQLGYIGAGGQIISSAGADSGDFAIRSQGDLIFASGGSVERLRIKPGGTIAIPGQGASNANPRLLIEDGAGGSNDFSISQYEDGNGTYTLIGQNVQLNGSGSDVIQDSNHKTASMYLDARNNGAVIFNTGGTNAHDERLRIASDGKLMTQASGYIYTASSAGSLTLYGGNTNKGGGIILSGGNSPSTGDIRFYAQMSQSSPAERLRITSDGVVSVGNQPKSWHSAYKVLQVGAAAISGQLEGDGTTTQFTNNAYFDQTNSRWEYSGSASDQATRLAMADGQFIFSTAPAGTADNALTWVERLRIDNNGVVKITNSNPPSTGAMTFITDDGSATTLGTSSTLRVANNGGSANYSVFEAESGSGSLRFTNDGKLHVGIHQGSTNPAATLHVIAPNNIGAAAIAQFGKNDEGRYARFVSINNQYNFDHLLLRRYDNSTVDVLRLQNTYASGTGWGTGIGWYGHGGNVTGRIKVVNATTNSSVARMHLEVNNQSVIHMDHAPNRAMIGQPPSAGGYLPNALYTPLQCRPSQGNTGCFAGSSLSYTTNYGLLPWSGGSTYISSGITYESGVWRHQSSDSTNCLFQIRGNGWYWYSSNNSSGSWNVATGTNVMSSTGVWLGGTSSDRRLKENITNMSTSDALTKVTQLQGVSYTWKNEVQKKYGAGVYPEGTHYGFIAQDVKTVWPEAHIISDVDNESDFDDDPTKDVKDDVYYGEIQGVKMEKMIPLLVEAIKELKKENDALKARVNTLESS